MYSFIADRCPSHGKRKKSFLKNPLDNPNTPWIILRRAPPRGEGRPVRRESSSPKACLEM